MQAKRQSLPGRHKGRQPIQRLERTQLKRLRSFWSGGATCRHGSSAAAAAVNRKEVVVLEFPGALERLRRHDATEARRSSSGSDHSFRLCQPLTVVPRRRGTSQRRRVGGGSSRSGDREQTAGSLLLRRNMRRSHRWLVGAVVAHLYLCSAAP